MRSQRGLWSASVTVQYHVAIAIRYLRRTRICLAWRKVFKSVCHMWLRITIISSLLLDHYQICSHVLLECVILHCWHIYVLRHTVCFQIYLLLTRVCLVGATNSWECRACKSRVASLHRPCMFSVLLDVAGQLSCGVEDARLENGVNDNVWLEGFPVVKRSLCRLVDVIRNFYVSWIRRNYFRDLRPFLMAGLFLHCRTSLFVRDIRLVRKYGRTVPRTPWTNVLIRREELDRMLWEKGQPLLCKGRHQTTLNHILNGWYLSKRNCDSLSIAIQHHLLVGIFQTSRSGIDFHRMTSLIPTCLRHCVEWRHHIYVFLQ